MANGALEPRRRRWANLARDAVLDLVLDDLDEGELRFEALREEMRQQKGILLGVLIALTTASILLALNIGVGR